LRKRISASPWSHKLRLFLRLGRCLLRLGRWLLWLVRWLRWALFKNNLSFPGNIRIGDLLSKLLQIEFDLSDSLFQGFVFVWHMFVSIWTGLLWKCIRSCELSPQPELEIKACWRNDRGSVRGFLERDAAFPFHR
jgi:hypothetical protein